MRKNKFLLLALVLILVMAVGLTTLIGCSEKGGTKVVINNEQETVEKPLFLNQSSMYVAFAIVSESSSIDSLVSVKDSNGDAVSVVIKKEGDKLFTVKAPVGGYTMGKQYKITVSEGATFRDYSDYNTIRFTISSDSFENIILKPDVEQVSSKAVKSNQPAGTNAEGISYSNLVIDNSGEGYDPETIIVVYNEETKQQEAFKVESCVILPEIYGSLASVSAYTPEVEEVFDSFEYHDEDEIEEDQIEFIVEDTEKELNKSEIANSIFTFFGSAPTFDVGAAFENGVVIITVTITVPNVVKVDGFGSSDLTITIKNELSADIVSDINIKNLKEKLSAKDFNIFAKVSNKMTSTVSLGANASYDKVANIKEIIAKLEALSDDQDETTTDVPVFKWVLPIGGGAANFTYQADLVFRFSFAGEIKAEAVSTMSYECGVAYTQADGLVPYQSQFKYETESISAKVYGRATVKIGVAQEVGFNVMGILGVGIRAELGNFNSLYGQAETDNLLVGSNLSGGIYFEGGFYYDVDLTLGLKIGTLVNLNERVDIVAGEITLYTLGDRTYDAGISQVAQPEVVNITASTQKLPEYRTRIFDLKDNKYTEVAIDPSDLDYSYKTNYFTIDEENGLIILNSQNIPAEGFTSLEIEVGYYGNNVKTKISFDPAEPILNTNTVVFDKNEFASASEEVINVTYLSAIDTLTVDGVEADIDVNAKTIKISKYALAQLPNGVNSVSVVVNDKNLPLNIEVSGTVDLYAESSSDRTYNLFAPDQIIAMTTRGGTFNGDTFVLVRNIDMNGAEIAPIANFGGVLNGGSNTISNFTVTSTVNSSAALFAENTGSIANLNVSGNVNVSIDAKTGKDYYVAGVVAVNNGTISNVNFYGSVTATNTSLAGYNTMYVGGLVATSANDNVDGTVENAAIKAVAKFDIFGNNIYAGSYTATEKKDIGSTVEITCAYGASKSPLITKGTIAK